jgi:Contact-dependent growth inhibition CdiA C-terminal domain
LEELVSKKGKIIPNGVVLQTHEIATIVFLTELGFDVELIPPINRNNVKTPDIRMNGLEWEIKCPRGDGKYNIEHSFRSVLKQSQNIIFDVRRSKIPQQKCISEIKRRHKDFKKVNRVLIIGKRSKTLDCETKVKMSAFSKVEMSASV